MTTTTVDGDEPPLKRRLRRMIDLRGGLDPVARELGLGREPLLRYLASVPMHAGTFALIENTLMALEQADEHDHCPSCDSGDPSMRPTMRQPGGSVVVCDHPWHSKGGAGALPR